MAQLLGDLATTLETLSRHRPEAPRVANLFRAVSSLARAEAGSVGERVLGRDNSLG
jgi:hypothetical protein